MGVILNSLLIYTIRRDSRVELGLYKHLLAAFSAYDLYLAILHGVVNPIRDSQSAISDRALWLSSTTGDSRPSERSHCEIIELAYFSKNRNILEIGKRQFKIEENHPRQLHLWDCCALLH